MKSFNDFITYDLRNNMGLYNMTDEFFCCFLNSVRIKENRNVLLVVDSLYEANKLYNSLVVYTDKVLLFPMDDFLTSEALAISPDLMIKRMESLNLICNNDDKKIVITNLMGYLRFLPSKDKYIKSFINVNKGDVISPSVLVDKLVSIGYSRDTIVNKTGEFAVRGFIIDVFPIDETNPIRVEFFDDEIESIRAFDVETQKSLKELDCISIYPFSEFITNTQVDELHFGKQKYLQLYEKVSNINDYLDNVITVYL